MMVDSSRISSVRRYLTESIFDADLHSKLVASGFEKGPRVDFTVADVMRYYSRRKFNESINIYGRFTPGSGKNGYI